MTLRPPGGVFVRVTSFPTLSLSPHSLHSLTPARHFNFNFFISEMAANGTHVDDLEKNKATSPSYHSNDGGAHLGRTFLSPPAVEPLLTL